MSSRGFSLALALLLVLSIGAKTAAASGDPKPNPGATVAAVQRLLADTGYQARVVRLARSPDILVEAVAGDCRLLAGDYPVHDTFADVYRNLAAENGRLSYLHRGEIHDSPPKARAMFDFFLWRELSRVGVPTSRAPVVALIASPGCEAAALPWEQAALVDG